MNRFVFKHGLYVAAIIFSLASLPAFAAEDEAPKKTLLIPKSPAAAAYLLGRLTNKELIEAPRGEFVFVALLQRAGLDRKYRLEALTGLVQLRGTDTLTELIGGLSALDSKGDAAEPVRRELAALLLQTKPAELAGKRLLLEKWVADAQTPSSRQIGYAGLITADGSADKVWAAAESDAAKLADALLAVPLLRDAALRAALHPKVEPLVHQAEPAEVRRAAISALVAVPGHEAETFATLAALVKAGTERAIAVAALQRLPRSAWPKEQAAPLLGSLTDYLQSVPADQRTEPDALSAFQFATDLATLLPPEPAAVAAKTLRGMGVSVFVIRTIREQMLFDKTLIVVEAGKPVELILVNDDGMPHNLVVVAPGALEEIGTIAEKMAPDPDAQGRIHVPGSPKVLHATKMIDPGQRTKLGFTAPEEPGDYQYVCTFPGHWRRMVGTLAVVKDVEAYLASHAAAEPTITEWKLDDLKADLTAAPVGRNLAGGRDSFIKLACAQCHKLGPEGSTYGPELTDVFARYQNNRADVLRQILEPSLIIADRYRNVQFTLKNGDDLLGLIVKEDATGVTVQNGASEALIQVIAKADIQAREPQNSSPMPVGLLNTLTKEQILDLLAYLEAGGRLAPHEHAH